MIGNVYLLGGGEIDKNETELIDAFVLSHTKKDGDIIFVGAASGDDEEYFESFKKVYNDGSKIVFLTSGSTNNDFTIAIANAKIVYLGGGSTEVLQHQLDKWGAKSTFVKALRNGTDFVGMSAGAYVLSQYYIHKENESYEIRSGLGLVSIVTQVHSTIKQEKSANKLLESNGKTVPLVAITEKSALLITENKTVAIGNGHITRYNSEQNISLILED